ncbi:hypothetical protein [Desulfitobacterium sp.]|uniref:hypothetical protein n=1 Tax=Desulfitobacterium sp. TaxID=49981 RepID=UPI002B6FEBD2|nr:hypothetical protein [Desulfitobacterium sp.]HVJ50062.1 hypothetical protein [Desulfitobacterium sp.]
MKLNPSTELFFSQPGELLSGLLTLLFRDLGILAFNKTDVVRLVREEKRSVASIVTDFGISQQTVRK